jgi:hypothetical protein
MLSDFVDLKGGDWVIQNVANLRGRPAWAEWPSRAACARSMSCAALDCPAELRRWAPTVVIVDGS